MLLCILLPAFLKFLFPPFPRNNFTQKILSPTHAICKGPYEYARRHVENFERIFAVEK